MVVALLVAFALSLALSACSRAPDADGLAPSASAGAAIGAEVPAFAAEIIELVAARDYGALTALAELRSRPCETSIESSPRCEGADPAGTIYEVFAAASCQGYWTRGVAPLMKSVLETGPAYAVVRLGATPQWAIDADYPYGDQLVIFEAKAGPAAPEAVALYLDADAERIVRAQIGCRRADQFLEPGVDEEAPTVIWQALQVS